MNKIMVKIIVKISVVVGINLSLVLAPIGQAVAADATMSECTLENGLTQLYIDKVCLPAERHTNARREELKKATEDRLIQNAEKSGVNVNVNAEAKGGSVGNQYQNQPAPAAKKPEEIQDGKFTFSY